MGRAVAVGKWKWEELVDRWRSSGVSLREFADRYSVSYSQLVRWRRRLEPDRKAWERGVTLIAGGRVELGADVAEIVVRVGAAQIEVRRGFDAELLAAVVEALGRNPLC